MAMPKNLLHDDLSQADIRQILAAHPRRPLLPVLDSAPWREAARNPLLQPVAKSIRERAEDEIGQPMPPLTDELYAIFNQTGSRWEFETVYFERRRRLARAAMSLLLSDKNDPGRAALIQSFLAKLTDTVDEPSWAFPAHVGVSWAYPGHVDPVSGKDPDIVDLFCAETANLMGEVLGYFGDLIPGDLRARILARLRKQIWENYVGRGKFPEYWWAKSSNNWNAVCHQGVLGSALAALDDDELLAEMLFRAKKFLPIFLSGFGPDGGSSEGPGYWDYGFGWFTVLNEQLETRTEGELSVFAGDTHVLEIARFGPRGSLSNGLLICFSDSNPIGILRPSTLKYLGDRLDDALCRNQASINYALQLTRPVALDSQRADLFSYGRFFLRCPSELSKTPPTSGDKNIYLADLAVMIGEGRDRAGHHWELAAKAGHNAEHHNHNDCGNYILNIDGNRFVTEIGQPLYNMAFFSDKRYENLAARSLGHSLPLINGCEQAEGRAREAKLIEYANSAKEILFRVDLTACYPAEAKCNRLIRTLRFEKAEGRFSVRDEFELSEIRSAETAIVTIHPVISGKSSATLSTGGLNLVFHLDPETTLAGVEQHSYLHHDAKITAPQILQRIVLKPATLASKFSLGFVAQLG